MTEHSLTYAALGASCVALAGWFVWALVKQQVKRSQAEGTLDDRFMKMLGAIQGAYATQGASAAEAYQRVIEVQDSTIVALRDRLEKIQTELSAAYSRIAEMQDKHNTAMTEIVAKVRQENLVATQRLHDRLDRAEEGHRECEKTLQRQGGEIAGLQRLLQPGITLTGPLSVSSASAPVTA